MDLHSKMTMYITSTMTSPVTKTVKTFKWLKLQSKSDKIWEAISTCQCQYRRPCECISVSNVLHFSF